MKKQSLKLFTISLIAFVIIISVLLYFFSERFTLTWIPIDHGFGDTVTLSPDDRKIVFPFYQSGDGALYQANIDGSEVMQLTYPRQHESHIHPRYSRNGKMIVFISKEKSPTELRQSLFIMNSDGSSLKRISGDQELVTDAIFSEDDQMIYYLVADEYDKDNDRLEKVDVYAVSITGEQNQKLTNNQSLNKRSLSLTEDGRYLGYVETKEMEQKISSSLVILDLDKGESKIVHPDSKFETEDIYSAKLSSDGELIAFSAATENSRKKDQLIYELYTMDAKGKQVEVITSFRTFIAEPVFFHQKDRMLFIQDQSWKRGQPNFKLWAVDFDGGRVQLITLQMPQFSGTAL